MKKNNIAKALAALAVAAGLALGAVAPAAAPISGSQNARYASDTGWD